MDKNIGKRVFHEDYPIDITNMSESEIADAVIIFRKLKGMPPLVPENSEPKKIAAATKKAKNEKKSKNSSRIRKRK